MALLRTETKVGIFVVAGLAILGLFAVRLGDFKFGQPKGYEIYSIFATAAGLKANAPVEMAGIEIGRVSRVALLQGKARVAMLLAPSTVLPADSVARIVTRGVLGDKYIDISYGTPSEKALVPGDRLLHAAVPNDLDALLARVGDIADDMKEISGALRNSLASRETQRDIRLTLSNLKQITDSVKKAVTGKEDRLDHIIANLERFSEDLAGISAGNKQALSVTLENFRQASGQMKHTMASLNSILAKVDRGEGSLGQLVNDKSTVDELKQTLASLKEITQKINQGKGTIGRLINDETTVDRMDQALSGINKYLSQADRWQTYLSYRGEYLWEEGGLRSTLNLRLQPRPDKFFLFGIVSDPVGSRSEEQTVTTVAGVATTQNKVVYDKDSLLFNFQMGKVWGPLTARAGIFQNTGGVGLDYMFFSDRLKLTVEVFDWRAGGNPHLKAGVEYKFWDYFYVGAGLDDFASDQGRSSFFLSGGISFFDEDLKFLLTNVPKP